MASIGKRGDKWHVRVCRKNHPTICKSFSLLKDAQTWARKIELQLERGEALGREAVTLSELLVRYLSTVSPHKKGHLQEVPRLRAWLNHPLAKRDAALIKPADVAAYRDVRLNAGLAASSVRIELSLLSAVFKQAKHEWGYSFLANPVAEVKRPPPAKGRERRLEDGELDALLSGARGSYLEKIILLAVETAMRAGELLSLEWKNVNFSKRTALLPDTKNGDKRVVPLSPLALEVLRGLQSGTEVEGKVFPGKDTLALSHAFRRLTRRVGISGLRFHDLRHEAVSRLFEKKFGLMEVAAISGHKSLQMLSRYTHLRAEALAERLGALEEMSNSV